MRTDNSGGVCDSRVLGGYLVMPTVSTMRAQIGRPGERIDTVVETLEILNRYARALNQLLDESATQLRDTKGVTLASLSRRTGLSVPTIAARTAAFRDRRNGQRNARAHEILETQNQARPAA